MTKTTHSSLVMFVHGGAGNIPTDLHQSYLCGCETAAAAGWDILQGDGSALDAVEQAVRLMEDNATFNAGLGSALTTAGTVEMDASIMDGATLKFGAVAAVEHYPNPVSIARRVMEKTEHHLMAGPGAEAFAAAQGFASVPDEALISERQRRLWAQRVAGFDVDDTVGAVALDGRGNLAAGLSTGGRRFTLPGRVGDSPAVGTGFYADNRFGAVAATGVGEHIMRAGLALRAMFLLEQGQSAQQAADGAIKLSTERVQDGQAGLIVLDAQGRIGMAHSTPWLSFAYRTEADDQVFSGLKAVGSKQLAVISKQ